MGYNGLKEIIFLYNVWLYDIFRCGLFFELLSVSIFGFFVLRYEGNCLFLFLNMIWSGNFNLDMFMFDDLEDELCLKMLCGYVLCKKIIFFNLLYFSIIYDF